MKKIEKVWGSEEWIVNNEKYCGKILNLNKGFRGSTHYHKNKHETFFILDGKVLLELDEGNKVLNSGDVQVLEPEMRHRFTGLENSRIIEFSTTHDDADTFRISESEEIDLEKIKEEFGI